VKNLTESILRAGEQAAYRAGGGKVPDRNVVRAIMHQVPSVKLTTNRRIALNTAIAALQELCRQRGEHCDALVEEIELLKQELERNE
jgi:hypothetical protein